MGRTVYPHSRFRFSGTSAAIDYNRLRLEYDYDSFANITTLREGFNGGGVATWTAAYDAHNRVTSAFGQSYAYDAAGRITSYEGTSLGYDSVHKHAVNTVAGTDRFDYDANGNATTRDKGLSTQQTLGWNVENHLLNIAAPGLVEWYYYDENGTRIKKTSNGVNTFYPFPHYEVTGGTATKYYFFAGMRVAMKQGSGSLVYLNGDHLNSTALATTNTGAFQERQGYYGYGKYRTGGVLPTDNRYTGQKLDATTGLMYYGARYYDRMVGMFVSPDSLVPDPTNVWDYNRYAYARLNPLKYNDPTGHETSKPEWWPDFVPYVFDLPDGMTQPQFIEWLSENNIPTTWGMQIGGDVNMSPYIGLQGSVELAYLFNWMSGEVMLVGNQSAGGYGGLPDVGFSVHGGAVLVAGASRIDSSIVGLAKYTTVNGEVEAVGGEAGASGSWGRAVKNLGDDTIVVPGQNFIDPQLDRTVDSLSVNVTLGIDTLSIPVQAPEVPFDVGMSHGVSQTGEVVSFNLYTPFTAVWNWVFGH